MKRTYYKTIPQNKEGEYIRLLKKLNITYTKLPNSESGYITLLFACTCLQKIRLTILFGNI